MRPVFSIITRIVALGVTLAYVTIPSVALAAEDIGKVISLTPGVYALRDGKTEAVALHAGIRASDTVQTDATGRVKILLNDDSTVSLGSNTTMDMNEYEDAGAKPAFGINVSQGVIRAITGKIVDQNPDGFKITTPEATVGIRGTIISLRTGEGVTTVYVENTLRQVYVDNINVPSGNKITLSSDPIRIEPILPQDRRKLGRDLALRGGAGVAAAAPEPAMDDISPGERFSGNLIPPDTPLTDIALGTLLLGDRMLSPMGHVSGSLVSTYQTGSGTFSFDVNLFNGALSNGTVNLSTALTNGIYSSYMLGGTSVPVSPGDPFTANLSNGSGSVGTSGWDMDTFGSGLLTINAVSISPPPGMVYIAGSDILTSMPAGPLSSGGYGVRDDGLLAIDSGISSGTFTK